MNWRPKILMIWIFRDTYFYNKITIRRGKEFAYDLPIVFYTIFAMVPDLCANIEWWPENICNVFWLDLLQSCRVDNYR